MTSPVPDKPRLSVVAEKPPPRPLRILVVTAEDIVIDALRKVFDADSTVSLQITPDTEPAAAGLDEAHPPH